jgi:hypothetical protein
MADSTNVNTKAELRESRIADLATKTRSFAPDLNDFCEWRLKEILSKYVPPVIIIFGTFFNALTVLVLLRRKFGKASTRILLISLAMADTALLLTRIRSVLFYGFNLDLRTITEASCPVHIFCTYLFRHFANWSVMLLTVERFISVSFPLKARIVCRMKWTCLAILAVFSFIFLLNLHNLFIFRKADSGICHAHGHMYFYSVIWVWVDWFVYSGFPFLVICLSNCAIIYKVCQSQTKRRKLQNPERGEEQTAQFMSMTYMLTTVSIIFILLTLPDSMFLILYNHVIGISSWKEYVTYSFIGTVTMLLAFVNNGINFLLYCVSGTQFRREVYKFFRR